MDIISSYAPTAAAAATHRQAMCSFSSIASSISLSLSISYPSPRLYMYTFLFLSSRRDTHSHHPLRLRYIIIIILHRTTILINTNIAATSLALLLSGHRRSCCHHPGSICTCICLYNMCILQLLAITLKMAKHCSDVQSCTCTKCRPLLVQQYPYLYQRCRGYVVSALQRNIVLP